MFVRRLQCPPPEPQGGGKQESLFWHFFVFFAFCLAKFVLLVSFFSSAISWVLLGIFSTWKNSAFWPDFSLGPISVKFVIFQFFLADKLRNFGIRKFPNSKQIHQNLVAWCLQEVKFYSVLSGRKVYKIAPEGNYKVFHAIFVFSCVTFLRAGTWPNLGLNRVQKSKLKSAKKPSILEKLDFWPQICPGRPKFKPFSIFFCPFLHPRKPKIRYLLPFGQLENKYNTLWWGVVGDPGLGKAPGWLDPPRGRSNSLEQRNFANDFLKWINS